jgi:chromosome segregation ATPase
MGEPLSTQQLGELRRRATAAQAEVTRLESQVAALEKQLDAREDAATQRRHAEVEAKLAAANDELERLRDELEETEEARAEHTATTEELERLVDSFTQVTKDLPELAELLSAMKLCVGALASSRRLERSHEQLQEPKDISAALTEALMRLASTLSSRAQVKALAGK